MQDLLSSYLTILSRHGLRWIITENQKVAIQHVLSAVRPTVLKEQLESDLSVSHHPLKRYFKQFLKHAICRVETSKL